MAIVLSLNCTHARWRGSVCRRAYKRKAIVKAIMTIVAGNRIVESWVWMNIGALPQGGIRATHQNTLVQAEY
jgi:hypothetical protein